VQCIKNSVEVEEIIKKSRFIGMTIPCQTETQCLQHLKEIYSQHPNASHVVFAYRIKSSTGLKIRFNDAGEPSGTAGKPVYQHLEGKNLINLMIVVIRYYGGIKLGAGGLTRAYSNTAKKVIDSSKVLEYVEFKKVRIELNYNQMQNFEYQLKKLEGNILEQDFSELIKLIVSIPEKNRAALAGQFHIKDPL
jgi:uncharacterized YigZ family protein